MIKNIFLPVLTAMLLLACGKDPEVTSGHGKDASVLLAVGSRHQLESRGFGEDFTADDEIECFRVLVFDSDGKLVMNRVTDISLNNPYKIELKLGTYDFVFIGNEDYMPSSPLTAALDALETGTSTISDLESPDFSFPAAAFASTVRIPFANVTRSVKILADNTYEIEGTEKTGNWEVEMKRLAFRLDMKVLTESTIRRDNFSEIRIRNLPASVPVLEEKISGGKYYNGGAANSLSSPVVIKADQGDNNGQFSKPAGSLFFEWTATRIILPSSIFDPDNEQNAVTVDLCYTNGDIVSAVLKTELNGHYQIPRNTHILMTGTIEPQLEIKLEVGDWDDLLYEVPVGTNRTLNVSAFTARINQGTRERIWFSSNMENVVVEDLTSNGQTVNNVFKDLAGTTATNFHYEYDKVAEQGSGYIDIMTSDNYNGSAAQYSIYLNARGLRREIVVDIHAGGVSSSLFGYFEYVGAFWRDDEVGERIIAGKSAGSWKAEVVNGEDWVVLGEGKSTDWNIYTENPGDPEDFPVEGDKTLVIGEGYAFFRIGTKSTNPNPGTPRYGRVKIYTDNMQYYSYIYLRQGEEADYLMRPEDYGTVEGKDSWATADDPRPRPKAAKFSPYNVTSSIESISGHSATMTAAQGVFTKYPSQSGPFFKWSSTSSAITYYHPVVPEITAPSGWSSVLWRQDYWDNIKATMETCPEGYRRFSNGETDRSATGNTQDSELQQSLWLDPTAVTGMAQSVNSLYGYYADGFFDRRKIENSRNYIQTTDACVVAKDTNRIDAAYAGNLFFNPDESYNGSVFFPCPGYRPNSSGYLYSTGHYAIYWCSSLRGATPWSFEISFVLQGVANKPNAGTKVSPAQFNGGYGVLVRCVKDE